MEKPYIWKANPEDNQDCLTSSGSDLLDPTCNRVLPHAFPSRLSLTSLLHYSLLLPLFFLLCGSNLYTEGASSCPQRV